MWFLLFPVPAKKIIKIRSDDKTCGSIHIRSKDFRCDANTYSPCAHQDLSKQCHTHTEQSHISCQHNLKSRNEIKLIPKREDSNTVKCLFN